MKTQTQQLKKDQLNGKDDRMINAFINGRHQQVSKRWFEQIYAIPSGKA